MDRRRVLVACFAAISAAGLYAPPIRNDQTFTTWPDPYIDRYSVWPLESQMPSDYPRNVPAESSIDYTHPGAPFRYGAARLSSSAVSEATVLACAFSFSYFDRQRITTGSEQTLMALAGWLHEMRAINSAGDDFELSNYQRGVQATGCSALPLPVVNSQPAFPPTLLPSHPEFPGPFIEYWGTCASGPASRLGALTYTSGGAIQVNPPGVPLLRSFRLYGLCEKAFGLSSATVEPTAFDNIPLCVLARSREGGRYSAIGDCVGTDRGYRAGLYQVVRCWHIASTRNLAADNPGVQGLSGDTPFVSCQCSVEWRHCSVGSHGSIPDPIRAFNVWPFTMPVPFPYVQNDRSQGTFAPILTEPADEGIFKVCVFDHTMFERALSGVEMYEPLRFSDCEAGGALPDASNTMMSSRSVTLRFYTQRNVSSPGTIANATLFGSRWLQFLGHCGFAPTMTVALQNVSGVLFYSAALRSYRKNALFSGNNFANNPTYFTPPMDQSQTPVLSLTPRPCSTFPGGVYYDIPGIASIDVPYPCNRMPMDPTSRSYWENDDPDWTCEPPPTGCPGQRVCWRSIRRFHSLVNPNLPPQIARINHYCATIVYYKVDVTAPGNGSACGCSDYHPSRDEYSRSVCCNFTTCRTGQGRDCVTSPADLGTPGTAICQLRTGSSAPGHCVCPPHLANSVFQNCTMTRLCGADCAWSWGPWSSCEGLCGSNQTQTRRIVVTGQPGDGGLPCPTVTQETRPCTGLLPCPSPCILTDWYDAAPCFPSCASSEVLNYGPTHPLWPRRLQRRNITTDGDSCGPLVREALCNATACSGVFPRIDSVTSRTCDEEVGESPVRLDSVTSVGGSVQRWTCYRPCPDEGADGLFLPSQWRLLHPCRRECTSGQMASCVASQAGGGAVFGCHEVFDIATRGTNGSDPIFETSRLVCPTSRVQACSAAERLQLCGNSTLAHHSAPCLKTVYANVSLNATYNIDCGLGDLGLVALFPDLAVNYTVQACPVATLQQTCYRDESRCRVVRRVATGEDTVLFDCPWANNLLLEAGVPNPRTLVPSTSQGASTWRVEIVRSLNASELCVRAVRIVDAYGTVLVRGDVEMEASGTNSSTAGLFGPDATPVRLQLDPEPEPEFVARANGSGWTWLRFTLATARPISLVEVWGCETNTTARLRGYRIVLWRGPGQLALQSPPLRGVVELERFDALSTVCAEEDSRAHCGDEWDRFAHRRLCSKRVVEYTEWAEKMPVVRSGVCAVPFLAPSQARGRCGDFPDAYATFARSDDADRPFCDSAACPDICGPELVTSTPSRPCTYDEARQVIARGCSSAFVPTTEGHCRVRCRDVGLSRDCVMETRCSGWAELDGGASWMPVRRSNGIRLTANHAFGLPWNVEHAQPDVVRMCTREETLRLCPIRISPRDPQFLYTRCVLVGNSETGAWRLAAPGRNNCPRSDPDENALIAPDVRIPGDNVSYSSLCQGGIYLLHHLGPYRDSVYNKSALPHNWRFRRDETQAGVLLLPTYRFCPTVSVSNEGLGPNITLVNGTVVPNDEPPLDIQLIHSAGFSFYAQYGGSGPNSSLSPVSSAYFSMFNTITIPARMCDDSEWLGNGANQSTAPCSIFRANCRMQTFSGNELRRSQLCSFPGNGSGEPYLKWASDEDLKTHTWINASDPAAVLNVSYCDASFVSTHYWCGNPATRVFMSNRWNQLVQLAPLYRRNCFQTQFKGTTRRFMRCHNETFFRTEQELDRSFAPMPCTLEESISVCPFGWLANHNASVCTKSNCTTRNNPATGALVHTNCDAYEDTCFSRPCSPTEQLRFCGYYTHECRLNCPAVGPNASADAAEEMYSRRCMLVPFEVDASITNAGRCGRPSPTPVRECTAREWNGTCADTTRDCRVQCDDEALTRGCAISYTCRSRRAGGLDYDTNNRYTVQRVATRNQTVAQCGPRWANESAQFCTITRCEFSHARGEENCTCSKSSCVCPVAFPGSNGTRCGVDQFYGRCATASSARVVLADTQAVCGRFATDCSLQCTGTGASPDCAPTDCICAAKARRWGRLPCEGYTVPCTVSERATWCGPRALGCSRVTSPLSTDITRSTIEQVQQGNRTFRLPSTLHPFDYFLCDCALNATATVLSNDSSCAVSPGDLFRACNATERNATCGPGGASCTVLVGTGPLPFSCVCQANSLRLENEDGNPYCLSGAYTRPCTPTEVADFDCNAGNCTMACSIDTGDCRPASGSCWVTVSGQFECPFDEAMRLCGRGLLDNPANLPLAPVLNLGGGSSALEFQAGACRINATFRRDVGFLGFNDSSVVCRCNDATRRSAALPLLPVPGESRDWQNDHGRICSNSRNLHRPCTPAEASEFCFLDGAASALQGLPHQQFFLALGEHDARTMRTDDRCVVNTLTGLPLPYSCPAAAVIRSCSPSEVRRYCPTDLSGAYPHCLVECDPRGDLDRQCRRFGECGSLVEGAPCSSYCPGTDCQTATVVKLQSTSGYRFSALNGTCTYLCRDGRVGAWCTDTLAPENCDTAGQDSCGPAGTTRRCRRLGAFANSPRQCTCAVGRAPLQPEHAIVRSESGAPIGVTVTRVFEPCEGVIRLCNTSELALYGGARALACYLSCDASSGLNCRLYNATCRPGSFPEPFPLPASTSASLDASVHGNHSAQLFSTSFAALPYLDRPCHRNYTVDLSALYTSVPGHNFSLLVETCGPRVANARTVRVFDVNGVLVQTLPSRGHCICQPGFFAGRNFPCENDYYERKCTTREIRDLLPMALQHIPGCVYIPSRDCSLRCRLEGAAQTERCFAFVPHNCLDRSHAMVPCESRFGREACGPLVAGCLGNCTFRSAMSTQLGYGSPMVHECSGAPQQCTCIGGRDLVYPDDLGRPCGRDYNVVECLPTSILSNDVHRFCGAGGLTCTKRCRVDGCFEADQCTCANDVGFLRVGTTASNKPTFRNCTVVSAMETDRCAAREHNCGLYTQDVRYSCRPNAQSPFDCAVFCVCLPGAGELVPGIPCSGYERPCQTTERALYCPHLAAVAGCTLLCDKDGTQGANGAELCAVKAGSCQPDLSVPPPGPAPPPPSAATVRPCTSAEVLVFCGAGAVNCTADVSTGQPVLVPSTCGCDWPRAIPTAVQNGNFGPCTLLNGVFSECSVQEHAVCGVYGVAVCRARTVVGAWTDPAALAELRYDFEYDGATLEASLRSNATGDAFANFRFNRWSSATRMVECLCSKNLYGVSVDTGNLVWLSPLLTDALAAPYRDPRTNALRCDAQHERLYAERGRCPMSRATNLACGGVGSCDGTPVGGTVTPIYPGIGAQQLRDYVRRERAVLRRIPQGSHAALLNQRRSHEALGDAVCLPRSLSIVGGDVTVALANISQGVEYCWWGRPSQRPVHRVKIQWNDSVVERGGLYMNYSYCAGEPRTAAGVAVFETTTFVLPGGELFSNLTTVRSAAPGRRVETEDELGFWCTTRTLGSSSTIRGPGFALYCAFNASKATAPSGASTTPAWGCSLHSLFDQANATSGASSASALRFRARGASIDDLHLTGLPFREPTWANLSGDLRSEGYECYLRVPLREYAARPSVDRLFEAQTLPRSISCQSNPSSCALPTEGLARFHHVPGMPFKSGKVRCVRRETCFDPSQFQCRSRDGFVQWFRNFPRTHVPPPPLSQQLEITSNSTVGVMNFYAGIVPVEQGCPWGYPLTHGDNTPVNPVGGFCLGVSTTQECSVFRRSNFPRWLLDLHSTLPVVSGRVYNDTTGTSLPNAAIDSHRAAAPNMVVTNLAYMGRMSYRFRNARNNGFGDYETRIGMPYPSLERDWNRARPLRALGGEIGGEFWFDDLRVDAPVLYCEHTNERIAPQIDVWANSNVPEITLACSGTGADVGTDNEIFCTTASRSDFFPATLGGTLFFCGTKARWRSGFTASNRHAEDFLYQCFDQEIEHSTPDADRLVYRQSSWFVDANAFGLDPLPGFANNCSSCIPGFYGPACEFARHTFNGTRAIWPLRAVCQRALETSGSDNNCCNNTLCTLPLELETDVPEICGNGAWHWVRGECDCDVGWKRDAVGQCAVEQCGNNTFRRPCLENGVRCASAVSCLCEDGWVSTVGTASSVPTCSILASTLCPTSVPIGGSLPAVCGGPLQGVCNSTTLLCDCRTWDNGGFSGVGCSTVYIADQAQCISNGGSVTFHRNTSTVAPDQASLLALHSRTGPWCACPPSRTGRVCEVSRCPTSSVGVPCTSPSRGVCGPDPRVPPTLFYPDHVCERFNATTGVVQCASGWNIVGCACEHDLRAYCANPNQPEPRTLCSAGASATIAEQANMCKRFWDATTSRYLYKCVCPPGRTGTYCEKSVCDPTAEELALYPELANRPPCGSLRRCVPDSGGSFRCDCSIPENGRIHGGRYCNVDVTDQCQLMDNGVSSVCGGAGLCVCNSTSVIAVSRGGEVLPTAATIGDTIYPCAAGVSGVRPGSIGCRCFNNSAGPKCEFQRCIVPSGDCGFGVCDELNLLLRSYVCRCHAPSVWGKDTTAGTCTTNRCSVGGAVAARPSADGMECVCDDTTKSYSLTPRCTISQCPVSPDGGFMCGRPYDGDFVSPGCPDTSNRTCNTAGRLCRSTGISSSECECRWSHGYERTGPNGTCATTCNRNNTVNAFASFVGGSTVVQCVCKRGFAGTTCAESQCFNGGAVVAGTTTTCDCNATRIALNTTSLDARCRPVCVNSGTRVDTSTTSVCVCVGNWTGPTCAQLPPANPPPPPPPPPCSNETLTGRTFFNATTGTCQCAPGANTPECPAPPPPPPPCSNESVTGRTVFNASTGLCQCAPGANTTQCPLAPPAPCSNETATGRTVFNSSTGLCQCAPTANTSQCPLPPPPCANETATGRTVFNATTGRCQCAPNANTTQCPLQQDPCANQTLTGRTVFNVTSGSCQCAPGANTTQCPPPPPPCANETSTGRTVFNSSTGLCQCAPGTNTTQCPAPAPPPPPTSCQNGGTPVATGCNCTLPWTGPLCETNICAGRVGRTFNPATGTCDCPPGRTGTSCVGYICENGAPYVETGSVGYCDCDRGDLNFFGPSCAWRRCGRGFALDNSLFGFAGSVTCVCDSGWTYDSVGNCTVNSCGGPSSTNARSVDTGKCTCGGNWRVVVDDATGVERCELPCANGMFNRQRGACVCSAGFFGERCELSSGDYGSPPPSSSPPPPPTSSPSDPAPPGSGGAVPPDPNDNADPCRGGTVSPNGVAECNPSVPPGGGGGGGPRNPIDIGTPPSDDGGAGDGFVGSPAFYGALFGGGGGLAAAIGAVYWVKFCR